MTLVLVNNFDLIFTAVIVRIVHHVEPGVFGRPVISMHTAPNAQRIWRAKSVTATAGALPLDRAEPAYRLADLQLCCQRHSRGTTSWTRGQFADLIIFFPACPRHTLREVC